MSGTLLLSTILRMGTLSNIYGRVPGILFYLFFILQSENDHHITTFTGKSTHHDEIGLGHKCIHIMKCPYWDVWSLTL